MALGSFVATLLGGARAVRLRDERHLVLGLAAGVMLGVVFFDLLPEAIELSPASGSGPPAFTLALAAGFLSLHVAERAIALHHGHRAVHEHGHEHQHEHAQEHGREKIGLTAAGALVLHSTLDGVGIGAAFQGGSSVGIPVAVAVIAHDLADGFNTFTLTELYGNSRARAFLLLGLDAVAPVVGAVIGTAIRFPPGVLGLYLGYFAGVLLAIATTDVLPEAHAAHPARTTVLLTVVGVGAMWLITTLGP
ncbi:ZIP family metal transporter [Actinomycetospora sp. CA-053990]|uniref:ZIP family metal transporter n=1 Tax=Actinomycetospora sp. CA-053990 TaxID=3239891 RepID=UPI003D8C690C